MLASAPSEPWLSFLRALDEEAGEEVRFDCTGGFVITELYGLARATSDLDALVIVPRDQAELLVAAGRQGSRLHKKYGVYLDHVTIASCPENYEERLSEMFPGSFRKLRLLALEAHDVALTKIERNLQRDRDDVKYLARNGHISVDILEDRYRRELRPTLANPAREDLTLQLWKEMIAEELGKR